VKNLAVVARLRNPSRSCIVRLLCNVSKGLRDGTMLNPSNAVTEKVIRDVVNSKRKTHQFLVTADLHYNKHCSNVLIGVSFSKYQA